MPAERHVHERRDELRAVPLDLPELATVVVARNADDALELAGGLVALQRARHVEVTILGADTVVGLDSTETDVETLAGAIASIAHCDLIVAPWTRPDADDGETALSRAAALAAAHRGAALLFAVPTPTAGAGALRGKRLVRLDLDLDVASAGSSAEYYLTASSPIPRRALLTRATGLATGVPPVTAYRSGVES